jgi:hypothetical protein
MGDSIRLLSIQARLTARRFSFYSNGLNPCAALGMMKTISKLKRLCHPSGTDEMLPPRKGPWQVDGYARKATERSAVFTQ